MTQPPADSLAKAQKAAAECTHTENLVAVCEYCASRAIEEAVAAGYDYKIAPFIDLLNTEIRENHAEPEAGIHDDLRPFVQRLVDKVRAGAVAAERNKVAAHLHALSRELGEVWPEVLLASGHGTAIQIACDVARAERKRAQDVVEALGHTKIAIDTTREYVADSRQYLSLELLHQIDAALRQWEGVND